jgi:hypothetical protein
MFHGSIVGRDKVDAITGATQSTMAGSAAAEFKLAGHYVSAGVNLGKTNQHVDYKDTANGITGDRNISLLLLDLPLLYNFHLLKKPSGDRDNPRLILSIGGFLSLVLSKNIEPTGSVPPATLSGWALGPYLRAAGYPFKFGRFQPGLYLDFYRSFAPKFYDEVYFRKSSIGGQLGIINTGVSLRF